MFQLRVFPFHQIYFCPLPGLPVGHEIGRFQNTSGSFLVQPPAQC